MKCVFSLRRLMLFFVCLCLAAVSFCIVSADESQEALQQKYEKGMDYAYAETPDNVQAVASFTVPARSGIALAALELGNIYRTGGNGIQQDLKAAETWYLSALQSGVPEAGLELGILYEFNKKDADTAKKYYEQYENNGFVDFETALLTVLYMKSANQGDAASQFEMGNRFANGTGVNSDSRKAFFWYLKSANNGYTDAKKKLAEMYAAGIGVAADPTKAQEWQVKAENGTVPNSASAGVDSIIETVRNAQLGDELYFGRFEQDNNNINGVEELKWKVINKQSNSSLLLCSYGIATMPYNSKWVSTTWENSSLREWLNGEFYENSFSEMEKSLIQTTEVKTPANPSWSVPGGKDTKDKVFLLSLQETEEYLAKLDERTCEATEYAKANGAYVNSGSSLWWLRTVGANYFTTVAVNSDGSIATFGSQINYEGNTVRPAMWLTY